MHPTRWHKNLAALAALLVLFVAIVAKIPTSQCHCHEKKSSSSSKDSKEPCPFAQLRFLSSALKVPVANAISAPTAQLVAVRAVPLSVLIASELYIHSDARAPPSGI